MCKNYLVCMTFLIMDSNPPSKSTDPWESFMESLVKRVLPQVQPIAAAPSRQKYTVKQPEKIGGRNVNNREAVQLGKAKKTMRAALNALEHVKALEAQMTETHDVSPRLLEIRKKHLEQVTDLKQQLRASIGLPSDFRSGSNERHEPFLSTESPTGGFNARSDIVTPSAVSTNTSINDLEIVQPSQSTATATMELPSNQHSELVSKGNHSLHSNMDGGTIISQPRLDPPMDVDHLSDEIVDTWVENKPRSLGVSSVGMDHTTPAENPQQPQQHDEHRSSLRSTLSSKRRLSDTGFLRERSSPITIPVAQTTNSEQLDDMEEWDQYLANPAPSQVSTPPSTIPRQSARTVEYTPGIGVHPVGNPSQTALLSRRVPPQQQHRYRTVNSYVNGVESLANHSRLGVSSYPPARPVSPTFSTTERPRSPHNNTYSKHDIMAALLQRHMDP